MPLLIVGDDPYDKGYAKHLREVADERVRFVEPVYDEGFHQLCRHCYLFLTASAIEGTSPALLQAMGQGAAVLVNGIPANRETIGDAGFAYRSGDERDLVRLWQYLVDHPADVERVGRAAAARVAAHYRWEQVADALESLFQSLSSG
jgi:glycosyltransferase involved in cell wall biosynthesis